MNALPARAHRDDGRGEKSTLLMPPPPTGEAWNVYQKLLRIKPLQAISVTGY